MAMSWILCTQLPGGLFSPRDKCKKLSQQVVLHFWFGMGAYVRQSQISWGVYVPPRILSFQMKWTNSNSNLKGGLFKNMAFLELWKPTMIFVMVNIGAHTEWKMQ